MTTAERAALNRIRGLVSPTWIDTGDHRLEEALREIDHLLRQPLSGGS